MTFNITNKDLQNIKPLVYKHIKSLFDNHPNIDKFTFFCYQDYICDAEYFFDDKSIDDFCCEHGEEACNLISKLVYEYQRFSNYKSHILDEIKDLERVLHENGFGKSEQETLIDFWLGAIKEIKADLEGTYAKIFSGLSRLGCVQVNVYRDGNVTFAAVKV